MDFLPALILLLTPAYTVKFFAFGLSLNILMAGVGLIWLVFAGYLTSKNKWREFFIDLRQLNPKLVFLILLFGFSGFVSAAAAGTNQKTAGQFLVLFIQPISLFVIGRYLARQYPESKTYFLTAAYLLLGACGLYALFQYLTLSGLPAAWQGNSEEPKRALSFFTHPNFYALFSTPLLAFLIPDVGRRMKNIGFRLAGWPYVCLWLLGSLGLFLSLSRAGWLGLGTAGLIYILFAADKILRRMALAAVIISAVVIAITPNLRWRLILPFYGEKSAVSRLSLWQTGLKSIKESPVTGLGLAGFAQNWKRLNTDPGLTENHNFPHNIFLDFWVETGLAGLLSFISLAAWTITGGFKNRQNIFQLGAALFIISLLVQGLIDNPYFKNDLAMVFWLVLALAV